MFSTEDHESASGASRASLEREPPLIHLLPRLRDYLSIVDPGRVDRAMELLVNCQSEDELFADLQAQYGDVIADAAPSAPTTRTTGQAASAKTSTGKPRNVKPAKAHKRPARGQDDDVSDFIVSDSEDAGSEYDEDEEDEAEDEDESESEIDEPEPDDDLPPRRMSGQPRRVPTPAAPPARPPMPTRMPIGPTVICKYGKSCYRKNPTHFQEFAHPWLLNQPGSQ